ncbi:hypothetical protein SBF1_6750002 [Candidatus Desulfosporosinus infrequens]|uniref:Uncharacterized protein n=1 Tax=Candidatus Desulfosporosinus infrequens TaxID=2043169 RepID=A0A2U3LNN0_9FIRM|nr:hypothetical protein SBF1_6750002 [Candidatus Desulfosporosinus infrequens]
MATYDFACDNCKIINEIKLTFDEHSKQKNSIVCQKCGSLMYQVVAPLRFTLKGEGWFGKSSDAIGHPYAITQRELNKNLDLENKIEDIAGNYNDKSNPEE